MKQLVLLSLFSVFLVGGALAQSPETILSNFSLNNQQIQTIQRIIDQGKSALEASRADIGIDQAKLTRLMLDQSPNWPAIEATLHQDLASEFKVRMVLIRRNLAVRDQLGREIWVRIFRARRALKQIETRGESARDYLAPRLIRLLREFR